MKSGVTAAAWAEQHVTAVRDDPAGRLALMRRCYYGPFGEVCWHPPSSDRPGSPWWRAVNERIVRDGCGAVALSGDLPGLASSRTVDYWMSFDDYRPPGG